MYKILLVMRFWTDGQSPSTRERNVHFTWSRLKHLNEYLNNNKINTSCKIYDFSPEKIIQDSIHIPFELGSYMLSKKTNIIIKESTDFDFIFVFDCDAFFDERDYENVKNILEKIERDEFVSFDLAKLHDRESEIVIKNNSIDLSFDWSYAYSGKKELGPLCCGHRGSFGGVYLCDLELLRKMNGFDESYIGWGGEDGDLLNRIAISQVKYKQISINKFAPFHLSHYCDWANSKYSKRFNNE